MAWPTMEWVPFIPRCSPPTWRTREAKLDGQRAQVHVRGGRTVHCFSRPGLDLLKHAGMAWLSEVPWPVRSAVFDGEACAGDGHEGIQAVFEARRLRTARCRSRRSTCWLWMGRW
jgi:ATP-dependent DNA ligase